MFQVQAEEGQVCKEQDPGKGPQLQEEDSEEGWKTLNYLTLFTMTVVQYKSNQASSHIAELSELSNKRLKSSGVSIWERIRWGALLGI